MLVGGSGPTDRDGLVVGIPILGQIAGALADAGYHRRPLRQARHRPERRPRRIGDARDYADDARAAVKLLADRKDVDPKRIAIVGHSEGGLVALMAAAKDKKIAAVALIATPGVTGADVVLAQQKRLLDRTKMTAGREAGEGRRAETDPRRGDHRQRAGAVAAGVRRTVDNAEFQSLLTSDPAKLMPPVKPAAADRAG